MRRKRISSCNKKITFLTYQESIELSRKADLKNNNLQDFFFTSCESVFTSAAKDFYFKDDKLIWRVLNPRNIKVGITGTEGKIFIDIKAHIFKNWYPFLLIFFYFILYYIKLVIYSKCDMSSFEPLRYFERYLILTIFTKALKIFIIYMIHLFIRKMKVKSFINDFQKIKESLEKFLLIEKNKISDEKYAKEIVKIIPEPGFSNKPDIFKRVLSGFKIISKDIRADKSKLEIINKAFQDSAFKFIRLGYPDTGTSLRETGYILRGGSKIDVSIRPAMNGSEINFGYDLHGFVTLFTIFTFIILTTIELVFIGYYFIYFHDNMVTGKTADIINMLFKYNFIFSLLFWNAFRIARLAYINNKINKSASRITESLEKKQILKKTSDEGKSEKKDSGKNSNIKLIRSGKTDLFSGQWNLNLFNQNVTDNDLQYLKAFKAEALNLEHNEISGEGVKYLKDLPLKHLYLDYNPLKDEALFCLNDFKDLKSVSIHGTDISKKSILSLKKVCPLLDIRSDFNYGNYFFRIRMTYYALKSIVSSLIK